MWHQLPAHVTSACHAMSCMCAPCGVLLSLLFLFLHVLIFWFCHPGLILIRRMRGCEKILRGHWSKKSHGHSTLHAPPCSLQLPPRNAPTLREHFTLPLQASILLLLWQQRSSVLLVLAINCLAKTALSTWPWDACRSTWFPLSI